MLEFDKNSLKQKELLTKRGIFKHYSDYDIFRRYCGDFVGGRSFLSPLREEKKPSFSIYPSKTGELIFNDFLGPSGDCVEFVKAKWGLNYYEALTKICVDFNLQNYFHCTIRKSIPRDNTPSIKYVKPEFKDKIIQKRARAWKKMDIDFWSKFGIDLKTLKRYRVEPVSHMFYNGVPIKTDLFAYSFTEVKDGVETYTIYQPFNVENKWKKSHDASVWYGWEQLPKIGDIVIVTKSNKDVMAISNVMKLPVSGLQNEKTQPKHSVVKELFQRFNRGYVLYDNDFDKSQNWGRIAGKSLADTWGFIQIEIPTEFKSKDFSDLVNLHGEDKAKEVLNDLINNAVPF